MIAERQPNLTRPNISLPEPCVPTATISAYALLVPCPLVLQPLILAFSFLLLTYYYSYNLPSIYRLPNRRVEVGILELPLYPVI